MDIILYATLLSSNDSALIPIAAATHARGVCILGGEHFGRFPPFALELALGDVQALFFLNCMDFFGWKRFCTINPFGSDAGRSIPFVRVVDLSSTCVAATNFAEMCI